MLINFQIHLKLRPMWKLLHTAMRLFVCDGNQSDCVVESLHWTVTKLAQLLNFVFSLAQFCYFSFLRHLFSPCSIVYVQSILLLDNRRLFLLFNWKCQLIKVGAFFIVHNSKVEMNSGTHFACNWTKSYLLAWWSMTVMRARFLQACGFESPP